MSKTSKFLCVVAVRNELHQFVARLTIVASLKYASQAWGGQRNRLERLLLRLRRGASCLRTPCCVKLLAREAALGLLRYISSNPCHVSGITFGKGRQQDTAAVPEQTIFSLR